MFIRDYRDLIVWQKAVDLAVEIYRLTRHFPVEERGGITGQLRRAALSVSSNIAEGSGRATTKDLVNFLTHSRGSLKETESLLIVSERLEFTDTKVAERAVGLADEVGRMLTTLRQTLTNNQKRPTRS